MNTPFNFNKFLADALLNVCEIPDRTSPEGEPDALVFSIKELESCIERAYEKNAPKRSSDEEDILVNFGDMRGFTINSLKEIMTGGVDNNHEDMVEEHIKVFNYAVTQGIHPGQALLACVQAMGCLLGYAIRSGMNVNVAAAMNALIVKTTHDSAQNVQIVTTN